MSDDVRKIRLTGGCTVERDANGGLRVIPKQDGGFAVVVQNAKEITMYVYHPLSGWYVQVGDGSIEVSEEA